MPLKYKKIQNKFGHFGNYILPTFSNIPMSPNFVSRKNIFMNAHNVALVDVIENNKDQILHN